LSGAAKTIHGGAKFAAGGGDEIKINGSVPGFVPLAGLRRGRRVGSGDLRPVKRGAANREVIEGDVEESSLSGHPLQRLPGTVRDGTAGLDILHRPRSIVRMVLVASTPPERTTKARRDEEESTFISEHRSVDARTERPPHKRRVTRRVWMPT